MQHAPWRVRAAEACGPVFAARAHFGILHVPDQCWGALAGLCAAARARTHARARYIHSSIFSRATRLRAYTRYPEHRKFQSVRIRLARS